MKTNQIPLKLGVNFEYYYMLYIEMFISTKEEEQNQEILEVMSILIPCVSFDLYQTFYKVLVILHDTNHVSNGIFITYYFIHLSMCA